MIGHSMIYYIFGIVILTQRVTSQDPSSSPTLSPSTSRSITYDSRNTTDYMMAYDGAINGFDMTIKTGTVAQPSDAEHPLEGVEIMWSGIETRWSAERAAAGFKMFSVPEYPIRLWRITDMDGAPSGADMGPDGWLNTLFYLSDYVTTQRQSCVEPPDSLACKYLDMDLNTHLNHTSCFTALINQRRQMVYGESTFTLTKDTLVKLTYDNGFGNTPLLPNTPLQAGHRIIKAHFSSKRTVDMTINTPKLRQISCATGDVKHTIVNDERVSAIYLRGCKTLKETENYRYRLEDEKRRWRLR